MSRAFENMVTTVDAATRPTRMTYTARTESRPSAPLVHQASLLVLAWTLARILARNGSSRRANRPSHCGWTEVRAASWMSDLITGIPHDWKCQGPIQDRIQGRNQGRTIEPPHPTARFQPGKGERGFPGGGLAAGRHVAPRRAGAGLGALGRRSRRTAILAAGADHASQCRQSGARLGVSYRRSRQPRAGSDGAHEISGDPAAGRGQPHLLFAVQ